MARAVVAGVVVALLGVAGLVRGARSPQAAAVSAPIRVTDAWVRQPVPPGTDAAAYFTVRNDGSSPDRLLAVASPAGAATVLHAEVDGRMTAAPQGVVVLARGVLRFRVGDGHAMIEGVRGTLTPGQDVPLALTFEHFGTVTVQARVVGYLDPVPSRTG